MVTAGVSSSYLWRILLFLATAVQGLNLFRNTSDGIHIFGLWSSHEKAAFDNPTGANISRFDFLWSVENDELPKFRAAMPNAILSKYIAFSLNSMPAYFNQVRVSDNLSWWQQNHPSWILYQCDRKTPATYWGDTIPLDISNPEVLEWQLHAPESANPNSVDNLIKLGFDAISLDVFGWGNYGHACGVFDDSGDWLQLYNGMDVNDSAFFQHCKNWLQEFYRGISNRMLLIPNYSSEPDCAPTCPTCLPSCDSWNGTKALFVGNNSDGELSEAGFTSFGSNVTTGTKWENRLQHMRHQQDNGKFYLDVSYWGPENVQTHEPVASDFTASIEYIIGSWMLGNEGKSALFMGPNDCSVFPCVFDGWRGNMLNYSQFFAQTGSPISPPTKGLISAAALCAGVWHRNFTAAVAFVNPQAPGTSVDSSIESAAVSAAILDPVTAVHCEISLDPGWQYHRLDGQPVTTTNVKLPPASALVLLRKHIDSQFESVLHIV